jgi:hypothetical protein
MTGAKHQMVAIAIALSLFWFTGGLDWFRSNREIMNQCAMQYGGHNYAGRSACIASRRW